MNLRYLLDTNIVSEAIRARPDQRLLGRLGSRVGLCIAAPIWQELRYGCDRLPPSRRKHEIELYLSAVREDFPILPYDVDAAGWHAHERARLVALGRTPPFVDGQIAAIAVINDLTLVTANRPDFVSFAELRIVTWHG